VRERLEARGADPSKTKDLLARVGGVGMILFARSQPDTPGKLTAHAYSYEHMEVAAYDLLALAADRAGDGETADVARSIREQESALAARLEENFDRAVEASRSRADGEDPSEELANSSRTPMRSRTRRFSCSRRARESQANPTWRACSRTTWRRRGATRPSCGRGSRSTAATLRG
jgi:Domain of unknown function (DUF892)